MFISLGSGIGFSYLKAYCQAEKLRQISGQVDWADFHTLCCNC